jgi:hypothetical protein
LHYFSEISSIPHSNSANFDNLNVHLKGVVYAPKEVDTSESDFSGLPPELISIFKNSKKDSLHFEVNTIYKFNGKGYEQLEQAVEKVE